MKLSLLKTKAAISRFAVVFPPPTAAGLEDLAEIWLAVLGEHEEEDVMMACKTAMNTLTRFPYPADIATALRVNKTPNA